MGQGKMAIYSHPNLYPPTFGDMDTFVICWNWNLGAGL